MIHDPDPPPDPAEPGRPDEPVDAVDGVGAVGGAVSTAEEDERRYPSTIGGACYLVVLTIAAVAVVVAALGDWRLGVRLLSCALGGAALARLVLPNRDAGMLAVRHRLFDVVLLVAVGVTLWVLTGQIPDQPGPG